MTRLLAAVLAAGLLAGCGGGGLEATPTLSPPPIDPRLDVLAQGAMALIIAAGETRVIDPFALARESGAMPAGCESLVFIFSWQSQRRREIVFRGRRAGGSFDVGRGASGRASVEGCILLEASGQGGSATSGELRYFIAIPLRDQPAER